jgi:hypothetical protein
MALSNSFDAVLSKHKEAVASAAALEKASKVIAEIAKVVTSAGYKSVDAFYAEVDAIAAGKTPTASKAKVKTAKAPKTPKAKAPKSAGGPKKRFTPEDRAHWKSLYFGEAQGNLKEVERLVNNQGLNVSYQTLFNLSKKEKWSDHTPATS